MTADNQGGKGDRGTAHAAIFELSLAGTTHDVRNALSTCRALLSNICENPQKLDDIELVMAETFNNIVEHALAGQQGDAPIHVSCTQDGDNVSIVFKDAGRPFANNVPPQPKQVGTTAHAKSLPEGGFGWGLIHHLTQEISYARVKQHNVLTIVINVAAPTAAPNQNPS
jgi:serine/threonine-protein kinase RsbW